MLDGETIEEASKRELNEEAGVRAEKIFKVVFLEFEFKEASEFLEAHIFVGR